MVRISAEEAERLKGNWYIVYTRNGCEMKAQRNARCEVFVPMAQKVVRRKEKTLSSMVPKFKNYIYVRHNGEKSFFDDVLATDGVSYFPGMTKETLPTPVPQPEIALFIDDTRKNSTLEQGDKVEVLDGYMKNMRGVVLRQTKEGEFIIEVKVLQRSLQETISREYLLRIE